MNRDYAIRPDLIRDYHAHDRASWQERLDVLRARDAKYRALNTDYGLEATISYHGQPDPSYDRRYKAISAEYDPQYAAIGKREKEWRQRSEMTVPEFLFLDNYSSTELAHLIERRDFAALHLFSFIEVKAQMLLESWKTEFTYDGMLRRVEMEISLFRFARKRCWEHFDLRLWDVGGWKAARFYRRVYVRSLREGLGRSRLA